MTLARRSGELERTYFDVFDRFARMIADGTFPFDVDEVEMESAPRVGDGVIVIDAETRVKFASPNAVSSLHRMGIHAYAQSQRLARRRLRRHRGARARCSCTCRSPRRSSATTCRCWCGCCRSSTGSSRRARSCCSATSATSAAATGMLLSKDATIREIHHRVKNNLQTIASLLRLQGRRLHVARGAGRARGVGAPDPLDRDRARDAVARGGRRRVAQRDRAAARPPRRGHGVVARAHDPLQGRGRRRRAAGRGRDAARGRAQRAHAERGRSRVPGGDRATRSSR